MTSETGHGRQRPSLIEFLTGGELGGRHASKVSQHDTQHGPQKETSSSGSYGSTPQANASVSEGQDTHMNDSSTPCNVAAGMVEIVLKWLLHLCEC